MIKIFYGENRLEAEKAVKRALGEDYEVYEGESLQVVDLPSIFRGTSLFGEGERKILLKDLAENSAVWEKIGDYLDTEHEVIIWEMKIDKRSAGYKRLKEAGAEMMEFPERKRPEMNLVFNILDTALVDGKKAVAMVEKIELTQDPYMFFGLMVTQMLKKFESSRSGGRERKIIEEMAKVDIEMKSSSIEPWMLIKGLLLQISVIR